MKVCWIGLGVLVLSLQSPVLADPTATDAAPTRVDGDGRIVPSPAQDDVVDASFDLHDFVKLTLPRLGSLEEPFGDTLARQVSMYDPAPGSLVIRYRGLQGFVVKRLRRRFRKEWRKQFKALEEHTNITPFELRDRYEQMYNQIGDHRSGGQWWTRTWWQSMPEAKGGAPAEPYVQEIGEQLRILEFGPLSVTNDFRARIDKVGIISLDPDSGRVFREHEDRHRLTRYAHLTRSRGMDEEDDEEPTSLEEQQAQQRVGPHAAERLMPLDSLDLIFDIRKASPWFEGMRWTFRARPGVRVKLRSGSRLAGSVYLRGVFDLEVGHRRLKALRVEARVRYRPLDNEVRAQLQVALLSW